MTQQECFRKLIGPKGVLSAAIRERDKNKPCIDKCGRTGKKQAGHYTSRKDKATALDPRNINGQNEFCNVWDTDVKRFDRHAEGIDERWGKGTAEELYRLSKTTKQWSVKDLEKLIAALKVGYAAYEKLYFELA